MIIFLWRSGIYGLLQAGKLSQDRLVHHLATSDYIQCANTHHACLSTKQTELHSLWLWTIGWAVLLIVIDVLRTVVLWTVDSCISSKNTLYIRQLRIRIEKRNVSLSTVAWDNRFCWLFCWWISVVFLSALAWSRNWQMFQWDKNECVRR